MAGVSYDNESVAGGIFTVDNLSKQSKPNYQDGGGRSVLEIIEHVLSVPELKPIYEQAGRLIGAYADKLSLDNQSRFKQLQGGQTERSSRCVYGVGSEQP